MTPWSGWTERLGEGKWAGKLGGNVRGEGTGRSDEDRKGVREKAEGRGQVNGMNRKGLVNG